MKSRTAFNFVPCKIQLEKAATIRKVAEMAFLTFSKAIVGKNGEIVAHFPIKIQSILGNIDRVSFSKRG